ncbi:MAG: hypothetical protein C0592_01910 [Marinilabiliales bacterium]|nr:MAG: hypothetical protein C0592_01910 [Marinilabiliales bacterium]
MIMKTRILNIVALVAILATLFSCSKYDEGPGLSFRSPETRVVGLYELEEIMIDEINYWSAYVVDSVYLRFSIGGDKDNLYIALVEDNQSGAQLSLSSFDFNEKKDKVTFELSTIGIYNDVTSPIFNLIPAIHSENEWTIHRLSFEEFWIGCDYNSKNYYLKLSKLEKYTLS